MSKLLNMNLLGSVYNWATVILIVAFGLFLITLISPEQKES